MTPECEHAFQTMKRLIAKETLLAYPTFNKKFMIHTDISDFQLGAVIMQEDKPLAFYSRKPRRIILHQRKSFISV